MELIFWLSLSVIIYVYLGYPVLLILLKLIVKEKYIDRKEITPYVTLIISAYNEEGVIQTKIENTLSIDYPKDKLEIIVVSDCSTDRTDEIVNEYTSYGVKLIRLEERKGKTAGLNKAVSTAEGEIIVFSDASAIYQRDAIKKLVRNFNDESVGYATGEARYKDKAQSATGISEGLYWNYEIFLKTNESYLGSMVGADGAVYAIRKKLYTPLRESDINDFVNPLQIIAKGYRGIYETEAICYENTAGSFKREYRRKQRIVNRSWHGLFRVKEVLNPFQTGFFSVEIISHKLLRWLAPFFMIIIFFSNLLLSLGGEIFYKVIFCTQIVFYTFASIGCLSSRMNSKIRIFYFPYYFCVVNLASLIGIVNGLRGNVVVLWDSERKATEGE